MNHVMPKQIGDYNKGQMLSILRERGPTSRMELSRLLGISPAAVTRSISQMLKNGIIRECGSEESDMGRKPVLIELCNDFCYLLGADIVGGTIKTALADFTGTIVKYTEEPIKQAEGASVVLGQLLAALKKNVNEFGVPHEKLWITIIGTPGIFDSSSGRSRLSFFLDGWEDIDIHSLVFNDLSVETIIDNDVHLDVIGECWKGVGKNYNNIFYVKLGQGLAARIVLDNKLVRGYNKMAGEIGQMVPGVLPRNAWNYETQLCNAAVSENYRNSGGKNPVKTISDLCRFSREDDVVANTVLDRLLDQFAVVLINGAAVIDPQVIILGGDAGSFGEREINLLKQKMEPHLPLIHDIIASKLDKKACLYGAIKTGLDRIEKRITDIW